MDKTKIDYSRKIPEPKQLFIERMKILLKNQEDFKNYLNILKIPPLKSIRCNKLKISAENLKRRLSKKWDVRQPWKDYPEIFVVDSELEPGELGRSLEHLLGYYYIQELASMLPVIALSPRKDQTIIDLCASPGSKTTQIASEMSNTGMIIANEISMQRLKILASNTERCGVANIVITKKEGSALCRRLERTGFKADKILIDAPCSGEGTLRSSLKTYSMWNIKNIKSLQRTQIRLISSAIKILKHGGEIVYSTCTHAPEENEEVIDYVIKNFPEIEIQEISLPVKTRQGITSWQGKNFSEELKKCARIYPHDNNTEGFFIAKLRKIR